MPKMTREFPECNPEWLVNNDWSAESRLKWIQILMGENYCSDSISKNFYMNDKYSKEIAIQHLIKFNDKKECEISWELYFKIYNSDYPRRNKPKDLDVVLEMLNNNKSITDIAQHFNVKELTVKRWIKEIKLNM